jgi:hypothetical protein
LVEGRPSVEHEGGRGPAAAEFLVGAAR